MYISTIVYGNSDTSILGSCVQSRVTLDLYHVSTNYYVLNPTLTTQNKYSALNFAIHNRTILTQKNI